MPNPLKNPLNYRFFVTPYPIAATRSLDRFEKELWSLVYSYESSQNVERCHLGVKQAGEILAASPGQVRRALRSLEEKGFLEVKPGARPSGLQRGSKFLATIWPDELIDERFARRKAIIEVRDEDEGGDGERDEGGSPRSPRGDRHDPEGGSRRSPISTPSTGVARSSSAGAHSSPAPADDETDEEDDPEIVAERREEERKRRGEPRKKKIRKRKPSGAEFAKTPSKRWEFRRHAEIRVSDWGPRQLVGYWACAYAERRGEEDPDLFFSALETPEAKRVLGNVKRFVGTWLSGNYAFGKKAVDEILELAERAGKPVSLVYFFTPRSDEALRALTSPVRKRGETHLQRDDREGSDIEAWNRIAREEEEKRRRREDRDEAAG